ncbi:uncharacterized protein LOC119018863 isoform X1 [Acanthopagrus latus]|uniref:uncharacterized protein LOC119018863 isoform X1 n=1 Tax=Acanthopagrus latus TaxID=8177 RepID=UPI00187C4D11|nr:uncharacterized protein LOC119018863 isoform X1 [Acanthopagrus latus]
MSLRSGRSYLKDYTTTQQDEASGGKEADVVDQATERHEQARAFDDKSQSSRASTRHSHLSSSTASSATKAYAKAKAARAQLAYAAKEADIMKQKADLEASILKQKADYDASLHLLQCERVAAAAEAEATAYEEVESGELRKEFLVQEKPLSSIERTSEYIQQQSQLFMELPSKHEAVDSLGKPINKTETHHAKPEVGHDNQSKTQWAYKDIKEEQPTTQHISNPERERIPESQGTQDLARYLIRREMVSGGLLQFDDKPENYWSWKASFLSATKDLNLSPREELDLMTKWLGAESSEQAKRIRAVHVLNPAVGVNMVWQRLEECYGTPEVIEDALLRKIENFPRLTNKDNIKLRELGDILLELECAKEDGVLQGLSYLDTARGVKQIVEKLPYNLQEKWTIFGSKYKEDYAVAFPPFTVFSKFVRQQAKIKNDPSFILSTSSSHASSAAEKPVKSSRKTVITTHKTDIPANFTDSQNSPGFKKLEEPDRQCPIHKKPHPLKKCKLFRDKSLEERKTYLRENRICYRCCGSTQHMAKDCKITVKCLECNSDRHIAALHPGPPPVTTQSVTTDNDDSGEQSESSSSAVTSKCTEICGNAESARSCSKICLVKAYPAGKREKAIRMYAVLDEQSNKSLAKTEFFDIFEIKTTSSAYTMKTCSGKLETSGRRAVNFIIESMDGKLQLPLPTLIECDMVPDDRTEIPTAEIALHHPHLQRVADKIQPVDKDAPILLLLGRDIIRVHKVREQINGPHNAPYAQRLDLGWVIVGEACLGTVHKPSEVNVYKTNTLQNGRTSFLKPCPNRIHVKDDYSSMAQQYSPTFLTCEGNTSLRVNSENLGHSVFDRCKDDDRPALSIDDRVFLAIMDAEVTQNKENSWVAPLPFRTPRRRLPSNREQALKRLCSLRKTLEKRPKMKEDYVNFMQKMIDNDQAEPAPPLDEGKEHWYLPSFGVYHPQKPDQIRVVFDSSAECDGTSLNDVLLSGPDLNNSLLGVLLRFRKEPIALTADVQQMFYCFVVREDHRDFLRYLWYEDNDINKNVVEYRMKVHVFGNSPSPAVAIYCMRRAAESGEKEHGSEARQFVERQFYVDDGLTSVATPEEAIDLLTRTRKMLAESNLRLHKVASNSCQVMEAFPAEDRATDLKDLDLGMDPLPLQRSLGLSWNLETDSFTYLVSCEQKPFTRRGVLSTVNSLYDPLGLVAPIAMQGKALMRELTAEQSEWDAPLLPEKECEWNLWKESLKALEDLHIQRCYISVSLSSTQRKELCIFSDASTVAIGAVAYLRAVDIQGQYHVGFVMGKSKLAPRPAHTIPRLELCAAVLAVELYELISEEIDTTIDAVKFFTDSKIVLGYIHNSTRRFYVYVSNRINRIRRSTHPNQWNYVPTDSNPADHATRFIPAAQLQHSNWFSGPTFLYQDKAAETPESNIFTLVEPEADEEIRPEVVTLATKTSESHLGSQRWERFSSWRKLCRTVARLIHVAASFKEKSTHTDRKGWKSFKETPNINELSQAKAVIIHSVQQNVFKEELNCVKNGHTRLKNNTLKKLNPVVDEDGLLRVGGRLSLSDVSKEEKHPLIIPHNDHIATLLVRHFHEQVAHQGRHITEGAIRAAGYWIIGGKRLVSSVIHKCITCRKLRGKLEHQKMADLPADRLTPEPPFTSVGLDVFGPWPIMTRRTRGGSADSKRWAILFTCMSSRAVHIELIETMSTDSFINALRRFFSIRGPAKLLRSDRGTNFVGACKELHINTDDTAVRNYLQEKGCSWVFNPPHASHMGGSWERLIGVARRILDALLLQRGPTRLTHEVLSTLMAEVMAIINARPIVPISTDPDMPAVLTPAMILTQKASALSAPSGSFDTAQLYGKQWKQVQCLADTFWKRWRGEYLSSLQGRRKWTKDKPNVKVGDVVLLKDSQAHRNEWPIGLVIKTLPSNDERVRKVEVRTVKDGTAKVFLRPVTETVVLLSETE